MATIPVVDSEPNITEQKEEERNSCSTYPPIGDLDCALFQLSDAGLPAPHRDAALEQLKNHLKKQQKDFLGYQVNEGVCYSKDLSFMLDIHTNNLGDPFENGNCAVHTKIMERAVLDYFAKLWNAPTPSSPKDKESYWGYVLSMGSTEGNLYALYNARDYLKGKALWAGSDKDLQDVGPVKKDIDLEKYAYHPVAFFSQDTHYSITKIVRALQIPTFYDIAPKTVPCPATKDGRWPKEVPSENGNKGPGSIDIEALYQLVEFFAKKGFPPLIILNIGTTFKGAYDNVEEVGRRLMPMLKKYNLYERWVEGDPNPRTGYWIHVDGALGASYVPFIHKAGSVIEGSIPKFDFSLPFVHSIVTSAHKYPGCPMPSGIYMTKHKYQIAPPDDPEYIGAHDTTFAGSRNAISSVALWCYYARTSYKNETDKVVQVEKNAHAAEEKLKKLDQDFQKDHGRDLWVERTPLSLSIRFRDPSDADSKKPNWVVLKYSLSQMTVNWDGESKPRKYVHIFIMPSVTLETIDKLIDDLRSAYTEYFSKPENVAEESARISTIDKTDKMPNIQYGTHVPLARRGFS